LTAVNGVDHDGARNPRL